MGVVKWGQILAELPGTLVRSYIYVTLWYMHVPWSVLGMCTYLYGLFSLQTCFSFNMCWCLNLVSKEQSASRTATLSKFLVTNLMPTKGDLCMLCLLIYCLWKRDLRCYIVVHIV